MSLHLDNNLKKVNAYLNSGSIIEAEEEIKSILSKYPKNLRAINLKNKINIIKNKTNHFNKPVVDHKSDQTIHSSYNLKSMVNLFKNRQYQTLLDNIPLMIKKDPDEYLLWYLEGLSYMNIGKNNDAISSLNMALKLKPSNHEIYNHIGLCYKLIGNFDSAQKYFEQGLALKKDDFSTIINLANLFKEKKNHSKSLYLYNKSLNLNNSNKWGVFYNIGLIYQDQNNYHSAVENFKISMKLNPNHADSYTSLSECLFNLNDEENAYKLLLQSQEIEINNFRTQNNLGLYYKHVGQFEFAIKHFKNAINLNPGNYQSYYNLGMIFSEKKDYLKSIYYLDKSIKINNKFHKAISQKLNKHSILFDWNEIEKYSHIIPILGTREELVDPLTMLYLEDDPENEYKRVKNIGSKYSGATANLSFIPKKNPKIKVGYFSSSFFTHAEMLLLIGVIENHNKSKFEIIAYSLNNRINDKMTERIKNAVDIYHDVSHLDDRSIAKLSKNDNLDIAIFLNGHTKNARINIFLEKVAPIQINFLGYPGSLGLDFFDYIIADKIVIPENYKKFYTEKIIYLPNTFLPTDNKRIISNKNFKRSEYGLPENSFVLCCFHNNVKITKHVFLTWLKILEENKNCVLWLKETNDIAKKNILKILLKKNIDKRRVIFAKRLEMDEYLASYRLADLFLDTFNYNGHTTVSEALWAGTPVVTKIGKSFSARVAASLLNAIGLSDLVVDNENDYINLILKLSYDKKKLAKIKHKLINNIKIKPLFDTIKYTKNLEASFKNIL